jgi:hypothetical protein
METMAALSIALTAFKLAARVQSIHHQPLMMRGRAQILVKRVREHAVRHQRVSVIGARSGEDHMGVVAGLVVAVAGDRLGFMDAGFGR